MQQNRPTFAVGAPSMTPLGSLQRSPKPQLNLGKVKRGKKEREGKGERRERRGGSGGEGEQRSDPQAKNPGDGPKSSVQIPLLATKSATRFSVEKSQIWSAIFSAQKH